MPGAESKTIERAALGIYRDDRRKQAVEIATAISAHGRNAVQRFEGVFESEYGNVSGSVSRDTHIDRSDFDIGILPFQHLGVMEYLHSFRDLVGGFRFAILDDRKLLEMVAGNFGIELAQLSVSFGRQPILDEHDSPEGGLFTAKFKDPDKGTILEISAGNTFWHRFGLVHHNPFWHNQVDSLSFRQREALLSQTCLLKTFLRPNRRDYPSGSALERLMLYQARVGATAPLREAMCHVLEGTFGQCLTLPGVEYPPRSDAGSLRWGNLRRVASAILNDSPEWMSFCAELGGEPPR